MLLKPQQYKLTKEAHYTKKIKANKFLYGAKSNPWSSKYIKTLQCALAYLASHAWTQHGPKRVP